MEGTMSEIRMFAGNFAPKNWAFCQGQTLQINTNQALFALLGTMYGGDGRTTFMLPNFAGRTAMGTGTGVGTKTFQLGQMVGTETVTCDQQHMPMHNHLPGSETISIKAFSDAGNTGSPTGNTLAALPGLYSTQQADSTMKPISNAFSLSTSGGSQPINIRQPYLGMNYIICLMGIFPSRS
ncbi:phage tail protein [Chryseobacterium hagamense]|uniref:Tail Collar domain-containing protein n=1 Tax=Chryseobacterium hagamense TaxID=395935 RepID=A0A511YLR9_9FLAO|nr:tail fiber protein [Chryseobacterium hagamense]GEN76086.1 tail Collar domain-containing protein [Chryseobacterium hagamense]